jgi:hypothetical protein
MSHATVVRYTTRPESAEENERLVRAVFAELAEQRPAGLSYSSVRLEDGVSFVHVAVTDTDDNPLVTLPAFQEFVSAIAARCVEGPNASGGTVIGSYQAGAAS